MKKVSFKKNHALSIALILCFHFVEAQKQDVIFDESTVLGSFKPSQTVCLAFPDGEKINPITQKKISSPYAKLWKPGQVIKIKFLNGSVWQKTKVKKYAAQWTHYCSLSFEFIEIGYSNIRVAFNWQGDDGSWSFIGTDALKKSQGEPTMNFGWVHENKQESSVKRVILHEFGHALGCGHEHQSPAANIEWNKLPVYEHYAKVGWSKPDVDIQVFNKFSSSIYSNFDPNSIMMYDVEANETKFGVFYASASDLSDTDKKMIRLVYPFSTDVSTIDNVKAPNSKFNLVWVEHNVFEGDIKGMRIHADFDIEHMKSMDCRMTAWFEFGNGTDLKDYNKQYKTVDGHVSTGINFKPGYTYTNYSNLWVFIPYSELHLSRGRHELRFKLGICNGADHIGVDRDYQYFSVTN